MREDALFGVVRGEEPRLQFPLECQALFEAALGPALNGPLDLADRSRSLSRRTKCVGVREDAVDEPVRGSRAPGFVDQAHGQRLFNGQPLSLDHELDRPALAYEPREPLGSPQAREDSEVDLGHPEQEWARTRDAEIARQGQLQAPGKA